jgi:uncharacterized protein (TIGR02594 family)
MNNIELFNFAMSQYGVTERSGGEHNPIILNYFKEIGHEWVTTDETAWCSAFMNWCCLKLGLERSGKLDARSWLKVGEPVEAPSLGDIVVYWREDPNSWKGHVGIYCNQIQDRIYTLGGNQNDMVCIKPYLDYRLLEYRRPGLIKKAT